MKYNKEEKQRSILQNNSLHEYCQQLADKCNEVGISQRLLLEGLEIDNSLQSVKSIFREMGRAKYGKKSTADLTTKEMSSIYEEFNKHTSKIGIHIDWPSLEPNFLDEYEIIASSKT